MRRYHGTRDFTDQLAQPGAPPVAELRAMRYARRRVTWVLGWLLPPVAWAALVALIAWLLMAALLTFIYGT